MFLCERSFAIDPDSICTFCNDTIYSQNEKFAVVVQIVPVKYWDSNEVPIERVRRTLQCVIMRRDNQGAYSKVNSYALPDIELYRIYRNDKVTSSITNNGNFLIFQYTDTWRFPIIENLISWNVYKIESNSMIWCKQKPFTYSLQLSDLLPLYPNESIRFSADYSQKYLSNEDSPFKLLIEVGSQLEVNLNYFDVKKRRYTKKRIKVSLEDVCADI
jgi:hypothetical protein